MLRCYSRLKVWCQINVGWYSLGKVWASEQEQLELCEDHLRGDAAN